MVLESEHYRRMGDFRYSDDGRILGSGYYAGSLGNKTFHSRNNHHDPQKVH